MGDKAQSQSFGVDLDYPVIVREEHIMYLKKVADHFKNKEEENYLLLIEKLLYLILEYYSSHSTLKIAFDPISEANNYLEKMNRRSVEAFSNGQIDEAAKIIARVVDFLNQKNILKVYGNHLKLYESKILTYNNLSCIYRKLGKLSLSLKVISFALDLEEKLAAENYGTSKVSIISTYLNKSSILSQMKKHEEALETAKQAIEKIKEVEGKPNRNEGEKAHIQGLRMSAFYNIAGEFEHLGKIENAISSYEKAAQYAKELGKQGVVNKIEKVLTNLRKK